MSEQKLTISSSYHFIKHCIVDNHSLLAHALLSLTCQVYSFEPGSRCDGEESTRSSFKGSCVSLHAGVILPALPARTPDPCLFLLLLHTTQANADGIQGNFSGDLLQSGGMLIVAKGTLVTRNVRKRSNSNKKINKIPTANVIS